VQVLAHLGGLLARVMVGLVVLAVDGVRVRVVLVSLHLVQLVPRRHVAPAQARRRHLAAEIRRPAEEAPPVDVVAGVEHLAAVAVGAVAQAAVAVHGGGQARARGRRRQALGHGQVLAVRVVEVGAEGPVLAHQGEAADDVADGEAGVVVVVVVVELVVEGLQGGQRGVGAAGAGRGVAAVAQRRHGVVEARRTGLGLQGHGGAPEGGPGEGRREVPRVQHGPAVLAVGQIGVTVERHLA